MVGNSLVLVFWMKQKKARRRTHTVGRKGGKWMRFALNSLINVFYFSNRKVVYFLSPNFPSMCNFKSIFIFAEIFLFFLRSSSAQIFLQKIEQWELFQSFLLNFLFQKFSGWETLISCVFCTARILRGRSVLAISAKSCGLLRSSPADNRRKSDSLLERLKRRPKDTINCGRCQW